MKPGKTYLKGKSVFIVSLLVIGVTVITVYATSSTYQRSLGGNLFISLGIISLVLFTFLTYGLYRGIAITNNFPKLKGFDFEDSVYKELNPTDLSNVSIGDGIGGIIISMLVWLVVSAILIFILVVLEVKLWFSVAIIIASLYWIFFRAMRLVFAKAYITENDLGLSAIYAFAYTFLYTFWMFGIVYVSTLF